MFFVQDIMVAEGLKKACFGCQLGKCLGQCCVEGENGGPLILDEARWIEEHKSELLPEMTEVAQSQVLQDGMVFKNGRQVYTPLLGEGAPCVYALRDSGGKSECLFEKLFSQGQIEFQKPLSCHLYPLIYKETCHYKTLSYERRNLCLSSWGQGVLLVKFAEKALTRQFGESFTQELLEIVNPSNLP
jgi:hypothetical protein